MKIYLALALSFCCTLSSIEVDKDKFMKITSDRIHICGNSHLEMKDQISMSAYFWYTGYIAAMEESQAIFIHSQIAKQGPQ